MRMFFRFRLGLRKDDLVQILQHLSFIPYWTSGIGAAITSVEGTMYFLLNCDTTGAEIH